MSWQSDRINALEHQLRVVTRERDDLQIRCNKASRLVLAAIVCDKGDHPDKRRNTLDALYFALSRLTGHTIPWLKLLVDIPTKDVNW